MNKPDHAALSSDDHAKRLIAEAEAAGIPEQEITEEVGHIGAALALFQKKGGSD